MSVEPSTREKLALPLGREMQLEIQRLKKANADLIHMLKVAEVHLGWGDCTLDNLHKSILEFLAQQEAE